MRDLPNQDRYPGQSVYVVEVAEYLYLVPFVTEAEGTRFLKTVIPSRKAMRYYKGRYNVNYELTEEEREILERFERGELRRSTDADRELEIAVQAARITLDELDKAPRMALHRR